MPTNTQSELTHVLVPSNIDAMMSGCRQVSKHRATVTLHYTDGTEESCEWPEYDILAKRGNFFSIIGDIQAHARKES